MKTPLKKIDVPRTGRFFLKDESVNPSGTIKDRRSRGILDAAEKLLVDKLVLITSGNNAVSLSHFAEGRNIEVVPIVDKKVTANTKKILERVCHHVVLVNLQEKILRPEECIAFARERDAEVIWDVTNGYEEFYGRLVSEIIEDLPEADTIVVPVGSGGIFVGVVEAIERINVAQRKKRRVIGVGIQNTVESYADKLNTPWTPYARILELILRTTPHEILRISEDEVRKTFRKYQNYCKCEPSSAVVFAVIEKVSFKRDEVVVLVNSGKGIS